MSRFSQPNIVSVRLRLPGGMVTNRMAEVQGTKLIDFEGKVIGDFLDLDLRVRQATDRERTEWFIEKEMG